MLESSQPRELARQVFLVHANSHRVGWGSRYRPTLASKSVGERDHSLVDALLDARGLLGFPLPSLKALQLNIVYQPHTYGYNIQGARLRIYRRPARMRRFPPPAKRRGGPACPPCQCRDVGAMNRAPYASSRQRMRMTPPNPCHPAHPLFSCTCHPRAGVAVDETP